MPSAAAGNMLHGRLEAAFNVRVNAAVLFSKALIHRRIYFWRRTGCMRRYITLPILIASFSLSLQVSMASSLTFTTIVDPNCQFCLTAANSINNFGQIVGNSTSTHAFPAGSFLYANGVFTPINVPSAFAGYVDASGINDSGQIVGSFSTTFAYPFEHGFLDDRNVFVTIDVPVASSTNVYEINNLGQIVGSFMDNTGSHAFTEKNGMFTRINIQGANSIFASGINNSGEIVGTFTDSTGTHGFSESNSNAITIVNYPGASSTSVSGINNEGDLVGSYTVSSGTHGFLDNRGVFMTIDVPGSADTSSIGINDRGDVVGTFDYPDSLFREGFVAVPTPEPAMGFLLECGLVVVTILLGGIHFNHPHARFPARLISSNRKK